MAGEKLTQRTVTTTAAANDLMHVVDVSDTTDSPEGTSKQITKANFASDITPTASQILTAIKTVDGTGSGLDADLLDGQHGTYFYPASNPNGYTNDQTPAEILTAIKTVDGAGSGLDADLLDGLNSSQFLRSDASDQTTGGTLTILGNFTINNNGAFPLINFNDGTTERFLFTSGNLLKFRYNGVDSGTIWHSLNDGPGSGLNADLLDGVSWGNVNTNISTTGTVTATAFFENSDERLKTNLKNYEPKEIKVNWKEYQLKNEPLIDRIGVSAQELLKTNPKFVNTDDDNSYTVNYIDLLCAKMAEKDEQIARLQAKVELLINELL